MTSDQSTEQTFRVDFGALCQPLRTQLRGSLPVDLLDWFQKHADAVTHLVVCGFITDSQAHAARKKILRRICREIAARAKEDEK